MRFDKTELGLCGNIGQKPVLRRTNTKNMPVVNLNIAVSQGRDERGQNLEPEWYSLVVFGPQAVRIAEDFNVGDRVIAIGYLRVYQYQSRRNPGTTGTAHEVWCNDIGLSNMWDSVFCIKAPRGQQQQGSQPQQQAAQTQQPGEIQPDHMAAQDALIEQQMAGLNDQPQAIQQPATGEHAVQNLQEQIAALQAQLNNAASGAPAPQAQPQAQPAHAGAAPPPDGEPW